MSFWVSVWTPPSFAFAWAALNLTSASCPTAPASPGRAWTCTQGHRGLNLLGFLSGSGGGFSELTSVASRSLLTGNGGGFTELVLVGSRSFLTGSGDDFTALAFIGCRSADGGAST